MLEEFLWPELDNIHITDLSFQQDGATSHTSDATLEVVRQTFGDWIITRRAFIDWPPRSCQDHHADLVAPDLGLAPETLGADRTPETDDKMEENGTKIHVFILSIYHDLFHQGWTMLD
ncbi:unnamed protein product [Callosobruchus maculatus]|uniref:Uncharacterized protein n=1 Tax=Callosobruchus maculatus TaxID=64391 RepID=A0A653BFG5_CALMS|nr:unnamed protein product [Callosobruchus maculatus]